MRKVLFPQKKFVFFCSPVFPSPVWKVCVTRSDLCRANPGRNDDVLLCIALMVTLQEVTPALLFAVHWGRELQCHGCRPHRQLPQCRKNPQEWAGGQGEDSAVLQKFLLFWGVGAELRCSTCRWHSREVKHLANILTTFWALPSVSIKLIGWSSWYSVPLLSSFCPEDKSAGSPGSVGCCTTRHSFSVIQPNVGQSCSGLR